MKCFLNIIIILKYNSVYFKVTQTSVLSNENAKYKCEISGYNLYDQNNISECLPQL